MTNYHDEIEDLMRRYGYLEKEAEAAHHLHRAWDHFDMLYDEWFAGEPVRHRGSELARHFDMDPHFEALFHLLARRVLARDYPEGWGARAQSSGEGTANSGIGDD